MNLKIYFLLFSTVLLLYACKSRQYAVPKKTSFNNDSLKISLPGNVQKLSKQELLTFEQQHFKDTVSFLFSKDVYNANEIIIGLWAMVPKKGNPNPLSSIQVATKGIFSLNPKANYSDKIITIGSNQILIMDYQRKMSRDTFTTGYYRFYVVNTIDANFNARGILQFKPEQKEIATVILNDMLKSIEFQWVKIK